MRRFTVDPKTPWDVLCDGVRYLSLSRPLTPGAATNEELLEAAKVLAAKLNIKEMFPRKEGA